MFKEAVKNWLIAIRAPFFTATVVPVLFGSLLAWYAKGGFSWRIFFLALIGIIFLHTGTNLANDYFDHRSGNDEANPNPTPFSGGSRVIQDGKLSPKKVLAASLIFFGLGSAIGLYLNDILSGNVILILGGIGVTSGLFYSGAPLKWGYRSVGEFVVGLNFGPLVIIGSYYTQAQILEASVVWASIPIALLIAAVLYINEFQDYQADKSVNKRTLVVVLGKPRAIKLYYVLILLTYLVILAEVIIGLLPYYTLLTFLTAPIAISALKIAKENYMKIVELIPANAKTIQLHLIIGLMLSLSLILGKLF
ncbi:MAG: 1,4-dihydroxy-2-naphthoate octaprenyltransferase [Deltaproteobacteria bacterium]|nr:MAG: 1,4-dihydroxy-2-naphthoate octaprenyltransferase [Deltaproteobacteria bacterium]